MESSARCRGVAQRLLNEALGRATEGLPCSRDTIPVLYCTAV